MRRTSCDRSGRQFCLAQTLNIKATGSSKKTVTINRQGVMSQRTRFFIIKSCLKSTQSQNLFTYRFFGSTKDICHIFSVRKFTIFLTWISQKEIQSFSFLKISFPNESLKKKQNLRHICFGCRIYVNVKISCILLLRYYVMPNHSLLNAYILVTFYSP